jgi:hypothetical protein
MPNAEVTFREEEWVSKQVILIIIDALTARVVCPAIERGELPTLATLAQAGAMSDSCVSMFPSITPAATATLLTGHYPNGHGIAGAAWYDQRDDQMIYYSDDVWTILREGPRQFVEEFAAHLNGERLQAPTLFSLAERAGLTAVSLNNLIHRGEQPHEIKFPWWLRIIPGLAAKKQITGPTGLLLGEFVAAGLDAGGSMPTEAVRAGEPRRFRRRPYRRGAAASGPRGCHARPDGGLLSRERLPQPRRRAGGRAEHAAEDRRLPGRADRPAWRARRAA